MVLIFVGKDVAPGWRNIFWQVTDTKTDQTILISVGKDVATRQRRMEKEVADNFTCKPILLWPVATEILGRKFSFSKAREENWD
jgi:hypothetical protein